jgi:hypothetical protein
MEEPFAYPLPPARAGIALRQLVAAGQKLIPAGREKSSENLIRSSMRHSAKSTNLSLLPPVVANFNP